jgi:hypothetical protein
MKQHAFLIKPGMEIEKLPVVNSLPGKSVLFIFGAPEWGQKPDAFQVLQSRFPDAIMFGCSSAGEIFGDRIFDQTLSCAHVTFEHSHVRLAAVPVSSRTQSYSAGRHLAESLHAQDLRALMILSEGLAINGSELLRGVNDVCGEGVKVSGGLAADGSRFKSTWTLYQGAPKSSFVTALGFYGDRLHFRHGSRGGWDIFGPERVITASDGNVLYELDNRPALELYKEYLGAMASDLPGSALLFPLEVRANRTSDRRLVRTVLSVDERLQALVFAGDVPKGWMAQLMRANFERLIEGAAGAARMLRPDSYLGDSGILLAISCVGRRAVLGQRAEEEVEATMEMLPKGYAQVGFYSYGEISPMVRGKACELHNQTMTLTLISET